MKPMTLMRFIVAFQLLLCAMQIWLFVKMGQWGWVSNIVALGFTLWSWRRMRKVEGECR